MKIDENLTKLLWALAVLTVALIFMAEIIGFTDWLPPMP